MLGEDGDLSGPQVAYSNQIAHHRIGFFGVACPIVEDVAVGRVAPQQVGAGEGAEKQRVVPKRIR